MQSVPGSARRGVPIRPTAGGGFILGFLGVAFGVLMLVFIDGIGAEHALLWVGGHLVMFAGLAVFATSVMWTVWIEPRDRNFALLIAAIAAVLTVLTGLFNAVLAYADVLAYDLGQYDLVHSHVFRGIGSGLIAATTLLVGGSVIGLARFLTTARTRYNWLATVGVAIGVLAIASGASTLLFTGDETSVWFIVSGASLLLAFIWIGALGALGVREG